MANAPLGYWYVPRPGAPTEPSDPDKYEGATGSLIVSGAVFDWATNLRAQQAGLIATGEYPTLDSQPWPTGTDLQYENRYLRHENAALQRRVDAHESRISRLEATAPETKVVVLRQVTREQAKEEIRGLFASGETLDYEAIIDRLQLDLELVVGICNELIEEGEIGPDAGPHATG